MKFTAALIPVLALTSTLTVAAPYQPSPASIDSRSIIHPQTGTGTGAGAGTGIGTRHQTYIGNPAAKQVKRDANPIAEAEAEAAPFYPIHPTAKANPNPNPPSRDSLLSHIAKGYGFGHGPVVLNARPKTKVTRRDAMPEPEPAPAPAPAPEAHADPEPAPEPAVRSSPGMKNSNGNSNSNGKQQSAQALCDAKHISCKGLMNKFFGMYGIFQNTK